MLTAVVRFCERYGLTGSEPVRTTTTAGRVALVRLFSELAFTVGAEIGVWRGQFSKLLCEHIRGLTLLCVDPWTSYAAYQDKKNDQARLNTAYREATATLKPYGCSILRKTSLEAAVDVKDGSLDFVYLDGNHAESFVTTDLAVWTPKVKSGGIVSGHDYQQSIERPHIQVKVAVDAFVKARAIQPVYVLAADKSPSWFWVQP